MLVLGKIAIDIPINKKTPPELVEKWNIESIDDETTKWLYGKRLEEKFKENPLCENDNVDTCWRKIEENITEAAKESIGTRKVNINGTQKSKPWFSNKVKDLASQKRKAYLNYRGNQTPENRQEYIATRNRTNASIRELKREYWAKFTSDMERDLYGSQRKVWKMIKARKKPINEYTTVDKINPERWMSYIAELYCLQDISPRTDNLDNSNGRLMTEDIDDYGKQIEITKEQVKVNITKLKNRKASGPDTIPNELIKYGGETLINNIRHLFQRIFDDEQVPTKWKESIIIPIYKKGDKGDTSNYRTITLLNTALKLLTKVITNMIGDIYVSTEEQ